MRLKLVTLVGILFLANSCSDYTNDAIPTPQGPSKPTGSFTRPLPTEYQKPNEGDFEVKKMLVNIGLNVIAKNVDDFYFKSGALKTSVAQYCEEMQNPSDNSQDFSELESKVKSQWKETMLSFHKVSMAGVGPLTDNNKLIFNKVEKKITIN